MLISKTIARMVSAGAVMFAVLAFFSGVADARPNYLKVFKSTYPEFAKNTAVKINCTVCHPAVDNKKKKHRNNYGVAVKEALGTKKEKDTDKITEALKKIASQESHVDGKTFGDQINDGKLPGNKEKAD